MERKIYNRKGEKIEVFSFFPLEEKIQEFRKKEIEKIPEEERVLTREDITMPWFTPKKGVLYACDAYILRMHPEEQVENASLLERYRRGEFLNDPLEIRERENQEKELILLNPYNGLLDKRVQITRNLYLEQLLETEKFQQQELLEEDLRAVKHLFQISEDPILELSIEELEKLYASGFIEGDFEKQMERVEKTSKVLTKLH